MIVNSDPVNYSGGYSYLISGIPRNYYVRLMNPENDSANPLGTVIGQSGAFTIVAPTAITSAPVISVVFSGRRTEFFERRHHEHPVESGERRRDGNRSGERGRFVCGVWHKAKWPADQLQWLLFLSGRRHPGWILQPPVLRHPRVQRRHDRPEWHNYDQSTIIDCHADRKLHAFGVYGGRPKHFRRGHLYCCLDIVRCEQRESFPLHLFRILQSIDWREHRVPASQGSFNWYADPGNLLFPGQNFRIKVTDAASGVSAYSGYFNVTGGVSMQTSVGEKIIGGSNNSVPNVVAPPAQPAAPSISISLDSASPAAAGSALMGSTSLPVMVFDLSTPSGSEAVKVTSVKVAYATNASLPQFSNLTLWNGSTEVASVASLGSANQAAIFSLSTPLIVPSGNKIALTVRADVAVYQAMPSAVGTVGEFSVPAGNVAAIGQTSNLQAAETGSAMGSPLTITALVSQEVTPPAAQPPTVTGINPSQGTVNTMVTISGSGLTGATDVDFYNSNNQIQVDITGQNLAVSPDGSSLSFTLSGGFGGMVAAGAYQIKVVTSAGTSNGVSFSFAAPASNGPTVTLSPSSLSFSMQAGASVASPANGYLNIAVSPDQLINWTTNSSVGWITVNPPSYSPYSARAASVSINSQASTLAPGTYTGTITFSAGSGGASFASQTVNVTLTVTPAPQVSVVTLSPLKVSFSVPAGAVSASPSFLSMAVSPDQFINWTTQTSASWIAVNPPSYSPYSARAVSISINAQAATLAPGTYTGTVTFSAGSGGASFASQTVNVTLTVTPPTATSMVPSPEGQMADMLSSMAALLGQLQRSLQ